MACDAATLLDEARCFACLPKNQLLAIITNLLCQLVNGETGTSCDPDALLLEVKCFACGISDHQLLAVMTYLTCQLVNNGGIAGGTTQVFNTYPDPPDDTTKAALSYPPGGGTLYQWDPDTQAWV